MQIIIAVWLFMLGAALGSFSLVLAWRMHAKKDWVRGRSKCDACKHELASRDLVPVFSWLAQRGRCRYCKKPIPKTVVMAEVLLGAVLALSWWLWPFAVDSVAGVSLFALWAVCCTLMSALLWYDMRWFILPNKLVYSLLAAALLFAALRPVVTGFTFSESILQPAVAAVALSGLFYVMHELSRGRWIGFGDVRLALPLGLFVGSLLQAWLMLFVASIVGLVAALPGLIGRKKSLTSKMPFGPLLITATIAVVLVGQTFLDWYMESVLLL